MILAVSEAANQSGMNGVDILRTLLSCLSIISGMVFVFSGTLGTLRLPDFFSRLHATGITDTLGLELILFGLILQAGFSQLSLKLLMVGFFLFITSPTATHAIANAAYKAGVKPYLGRYRSPDPANIADTQKQDS